MDNSGGDMPGMPVNVGSDYNLCWALCNKTAGCAAWAYGVPSCGGSGVPRRCDVHMRVVGGLGPSSTLVTVGHCGV